jgi:glycerol-3-phosphate dehydrogenase
VHLDDLILRRTSIGWLGGYNREKLIEIANKTGEVVGWNGKKVNEEVERTIAILKEKHGVSL